MGSQYGEKKGRLKKPIWFGKKTGSQYGGKKGKIKKQQYDLVKRLGKSIWWEKNEKA